MICKGGCPSFLGIWSLEEEDGYVQPLAGSVGSTWECLGSRFRLPCHAMGLEVMFCVWVGQPAWLSASAGFQGEHHSCSRSLAGLAGQAGLEAMSSS